MNGRMAVLEIVNSIKDFLFPPVCPSCEAAIISGGLICPDCMDAFTEEAMQYDTKPRLIDNVSDISVLLPYTTACRRIVHTLKYRGMPSIGFIMGKLMAQKTLSRVSLSENAVLVPVPLHPDRLRERGYNQSERLAQGFASFSGHKIRTDIIKRIRKTETQTALDHEQRAQNVQNAFVFCGDTSLSSCEVILIDDVMTTGSTISACAGTLRNGGAERITVSVLATPDPGTE